MKKKCLYCGGNCPNEPSDSPYICDGFAGDIDGLYEFYVGEEVVCTPDNEDDWHEFQGVVIDVKGAIYLVRDQQDDVFYCEFHQMKRVEK